MESGKAARLLAKVLQQCQTVLESQEAVKALWSQSRLHWNTLGISDDHLGDFLVEMVGCCILQAAVLDFSCLSLCQNLGYLCVEVGQLQEGDAPYLQELQQLLGSDKPNSDIIDWIKVCTLSSMNFHIFMHLYIL